MTMNIMPSKIHVSGGAITIEIPTEMIKRALETAEQDQSQSNGAPRAYLRKYRGALEDALHIDPSDYQRQVRAEWDDASA